MLPIRTISSFGWALLTLCLTGRSFAGPGEVDTTFNTGANNTIYSVLTQPDGKIIIGGAFTSVAGFSRGGYARLYPDGTFDGSFTNLISVGGTVYAMLMQPDGKLLLAGSFSATTQSRQGVLRLNVDGSIDGTFTNSSPSSTVYALALQSDGKVLIGGQFTTVGAYPNNSIHYYIARLNSDGTVDNSFNAGNISGSSVNAIAVQADGNILIGGSFGSFTTYGVTRNNIARLLTNGVPDLTYQAQASGIVQSVYLQPNGKSVWGGTFNSLDLNTRQRIGRLNFDGTLDGTFTAPVGANNTVYTVTEDTFGNIYCGGLFSAYNNIIREGVARLFSDGTFDTSFNSTTNFPTPQIRCLAVQGDGRVLVGGSFTTFNSFPRTNLVRLYGDEYPAEITKQPQSSNVVAGTNVTFSVEVSNPTEVYYQWMKDGVDIPGAVYNEYSIFNAQFADAGTYSVFVSTGFGGVDSTNAVLQVGIPASITQQPTNLTVVQGQTATFTAAASGTPLNYYWKFGTSLVGTNSTLVLTNVLPNQAGLYTFIASNFLGSATSSAVRLAVLYPVGITGNPADEAVPVGGTASFQVTATGNPQSFQWLYGGNPIPGAVSQVYSIANVTLANAGGYSVIVSNQFNSVTSSVANLSVGYPPTVTMQPASVTNNLGDTTGFNCAVTGSTNITVQWLFNGNPLSNQFSTNLTLTNVQIASIGNYSMSAVNSFGSTVSSNAFLYLNGYPSNLYFGLVAYYPFTGNANDATGNGFNGTVNGAVPSADRFGSPNSAYDFQGSQNINFTSVPLAQTDNWTMSVWISPDSLPQAGIAVGMGMDSGVNFDGMELGISDGNYGQGQLLFGSLSGNAFSSGYAFTNTNQWHQALMVRSSGTTSIYVDGVLTAATSTVTPATPSSFTIGSATSGDFFLGILDDVRIYNRALSPGDIQQLYALENGQPVITQQPQSLMVFSGGSASFTVQATGVGPLYYQWYSTNFGLLSTATNSTMTLPYVLSANASGYYVVVSNSYGTATSSVANLAVGNPPQSLRVSLVSKRYPLIEMPGTPGFNYMLQTTTNLQPPVVWQNVGLIQADTNCMCSFVDSNAPANGAQFYRISGP
jgi:uncharacterized delta-60 repeat protein